MTTFLDLIEETRHHLMTGQPDRLNVLNGSIDNDDTSFTLTYSNKGISEGSILCIGLEEMSVISFNNVGDMVNVVVIRGMNGSTKVAHTAGDIVYVNPQFSSFWLGKYVNQAFNDLSGENLYQMRHQTLTSATTTLSYDLDDLDGFISIWRVRYSTTGVSNLWPILRPDEYIVDLAADTTAFPSGKALLIKEGIETSQTIRVSYRASFDQLVNLTDNVTTVTGLHDEAHDLPSMYAAIHLLAGREVKRSFLNRQPEPRRQEEVPPGAASQAMNPLVKLFQGRLDIEAKRLKRMYPVAV